MDEIKENENIDWESSLLRARGEDHAARARMWDAIALGVSAIATAVVELIAEERADRGQSR